MSRWSQSLEDRFWSKVDKNGPLIREDLGPCWVFTRNQNQRGYGRFCMPKTEGKGSRQWIAPRVAYFLTFEDFDPSLSTLHRCDYPPCCRPDHLFQGTHIDNMADMVAKGRSLSGDRNVTRRYPERLRRGETSPASKLTADQVLTIRERYTAGESARDIAADFGIVQVHVNQIARGKVWAHVGGIVPAEVRAEHQRAQIRGENGVHTKLTTAQVIEMRMRHAKGESAADMEGDYPIAVHSIDGVLRGNSWKHIKVEVDA